MSSENSDRINKLDERLSQIQGNISSSKSKKIQFWATSITQIEQTQVEVEEQTQLKSSQLQEAANRIQQALEQIKELSGEPHLAEISSVRYSLKEMLEKEISTRHETENLLYTKVEDGLNQLRNDIKNESSSWQDSLNHFSGFINNDLPVLRDSIDQQIQDREENDTQTETILLEHIEKLNEALLNERSAREFQEEKIIDSMKQIQAELRKELQQTRKDREIEEENLALMLDKTCDKLRTAAEIQ